MKFNNGYVFPHPVLGINDDVIGSASAAVTIDENSDPDNYILALQYQLDNADIRKLLEEKKAELVCELSCTATLYRASKFGFSLSQTIILPKNAVREEVEMLFLMVTREDLPQYINSGAHPDFVGYHFDLQKGDVLAYFGETRFIAGIAWQKLKAVSSFMEITEGEIDEGNFNLILEKSKIQIQLSRSDYNKYREPAIVNNKEFASTFHTGIVLPALIHALYKLFGPSGDDISETAWAKIIRFRLDNEEGLRGIIPDVDNILKIAQYLLGLPVGRLLTDLHNKVTAVTEE